MRTSLLRPGLYLLWLNLLRTLCISKPASLYLLGLVPRPLRLGRLRRRSLPLPKIPLLLCANLFCLLDSHILTRLNRLSRLSRLHTLLPGQLPLLRLHATLRTLRKPGLLLPSGLADLRRWPLILQILFHPRKGRRGA